MARSAFFALICHGCLGAFIPLTVAFLGSLKPLQWGEGPWLIHLTRQKRGSIGIAAFSMRLTRRANFHRASRVGHLHDGDAPARDWLARLASGLHKQGLRLPNAQGRTLALLDKAVGRQALMLAFNNACVLIGLAFVPALPL